MAALMCSSLDLYNHFIIISISVMWPSGIYVHICNDFSPDVRDLLEIPINQRLVLDVSFNYVD